jgi:anti-sigma B factor antagonist
MSVVNSQFMLVRQAGPGDRVVTASGEIDLYTAPRLRQVLSDALLTRPDGLTIDMADISFMDSTGINLIAGMMKQCQAAKVKL